MATLASLALPLLAFGAEKASSPSLPSYAYKPTPATAGANKAPRNTPYSSEEAAKAAALPAVALPAVAVHEPVNRAVAMVQDALNQEATMESCALITTHLSDDRSLDYGVSPEASPAPAGGASSLARTANVALTRYRW